VPTEIGEFVVGAYLKEIEQCDFVDYNVRPPGGGIKGLGEMDVLGLRFTDGTVFLCEVATHLGGLEYGGGYEATARKIEEKIARAREYARESLERFPNRRFSFWSPRVPKGALTSLLAGIAEVEMVINQEYADRVSALVALASKTTRETGNPFFRSLQLLGHLRKQN
jgi:hypothetical protein